MESPDYKKQDILQRLCEMFSWISLDDLRNICEKNEWSLEKCIDTIIDTENDGKVEGIPVPPSYIPEIKHVRIHHKSEPVNGSNVDEVVDKIKRGYRVLILMRGSPGSGKSHLASEVVRRSVTFDEQYNLHDFVFSSDDYFYDISGSYKYRLDKLEEAHLFNQGRVRKKAQDGWSPIIVDNTNMQLWEMMPYVRIGVDNGYILEILEPSTPWRNSATKLAMKNKHNVPREKIQRMMDKYEKGTVNDLLRMLKTTNYRVSMPQMRRYPMIAENITNFKICTSRSENDLGNNIMNNKRNNNPLKETEKPSTSDSWKPYEEEANSFWCLDSKIKDVSNKEPKTNKTLLDLLREDVASEKQSENKNVLEDYQHDQLKSLKCHSINCPNENKSFFMLRQIYPTKEVSSLWDLFVKCKGDVDWAVDILIKEEESFSDSDISVMQNSVTNIQCNCTSKDSISRAQPANILKIGTNSPNILPKPQRERSRTSKTNQSKTNNDELLSIKKRIENIFVFPEKHSTENERKQRSYPTKNCSTDAETQTISTEDDNEEFSMDEMLELTLGDQLVRQLNSYFKEEISLFEKISDDLNTNIFIPRSLAKQIFMLWVESAYNQMEEHQQELLHHDECFARLLKNPDFEDCKETPENIEEILNEPWSNFENFNEDIQYNPVELNYPTNLATHLSRMKLCEMFPSIPQETLSDILATYDNDYTKTVDLLQKSNDFAGSSKAMHAFLSENANQQGSSIGGRDKSHDIPKASMVSREYNDSQISPEEAKHLALREFEETRNLAAHHCQLKAECFEKAKDAFQKGNGGVAAYYSQIASLHKRKIDMYNHRAANCIVEVHKHTQCNPDLLDLHYLHVAEAVECLNIFLDQHITGLRLSSRGYKHVFLITGRGLHSVGGISSIKKKVKTHLKERHLRWTEINPGLLRVKLYSYSRHTTHF